MQLAHDLASSSEDASVHDVPFLEHLGEGPILGTARKPKLLVTSRCQHFCAQNRYPKLEPKMDVFFNIKPFAIAGLD